MKNSAAFIKGFTLIELLIAVVIIGILTAIAFPSYQNSVRQARRAEAQGALTQLSNAMERVFTQNGTYRPGGAAPILGTVAGAIFPALAPLDGATKYYNLTISTAAPVLTATTFTLRATPIVGTVQDGDGVIELDHTGAKRWDAGSDGLTAADNSWR